MCKNVWFYYHGKAFTRWYRQTPTTRVSQWYKKLRRKYNKSRGENESSSTKYKQQSDSFVPIEWMNCSLLWNENENHRNEHKEMAKYEFNSLFMPKQFFPFLWLTNAKKNIPTNDNWRVSIHVFHLHKKKCKNNIFHFEIFFFCLYSYFKRSRSSVGGGGGTVSVFSFSIFVGFIKQYFRYLSQKTDVIHNIYISVQLNKCSVAP